MLNPYRPESRRIFDLPTAEEEAEMRAGIAGGEDSRELNEAELQALRPVGRPKAADAEQGVSIHLSPEILR
jgi:hypothetical protein